MSTDRERIVRLEEQVKTLYGVIKWMVTVMGTVAAGLAVQWFAHTGWMW